VSFSFCFNPHPTSLDRPTLDNRIISARSADRSTTFARGLLTAVTSIILLIVNVIVVIAARGSLSVDSLRTFATLSILRGICVFPLLRPAFTYPSTCLLRRCTPSLPPQPFIGRGRAYPHDFPYPHPPPPTPRISSYLLHALSLFTLWIHRATWPARSRWAVVHSALLENSSLLFVSRARVYSLGLLLVVVKTVFNRFSLYERNTNEIRTKNHNSTIRLHPRASPRWLCNNVYNVSGKRIWSNCVPCIVPWPAVIIIELVQRSRNRHHRRLTPIPA